MSRKSVLGRVGSSRQMLKYGTIGDNGLRPKHDLLFLWKVYGFDI